MSTILSDDPLTLAFELLGGSPAAVVDPYPHYHALRQRAPVLAFELAGEPALVLTGYDDCRQVLRDPRLGKDEDSRRARYDAMRHEHGIEFTAERRDAPLLFLNPPDHTRVRSLVSRAFTPRRVATLEPRIHELVAELLDDVVEQVGGGGEVDLLDVFGFPLPVAVIGELVGVPSADWPRFRTLVRDAASSLELSAGIDEAVTADRALAEMDAYFVDLVEERRRRPQDDLLSALVAVEDGGDRLSLGELLSTSILMFAAGFETTTNLIGNGTAALLAHPDELARLRSDRSLLPSAVDELLRYDSPVQLDGRTALEDADLPDGTPVTAGTTLITLIGAANRDPATFPDPDRLDLGRKGEHALSFAWGIHHCLGAALARAEGVAAFGALLDRFATIEAVDDPLPWRRSLTLRGLDRLPVHLTPA